MCAVIATLVLYIYHGNDMETQNNAENNDMTSQNNTENNDMTSQNNAEK